MSKECLHTIAISIQLCLSGIQLRGLLATSINSQHKNLRAEKRNSIKVYFNGMNSSRETNL